MNYKISVCMATYNGAKFIKKQIDSILLQLGHDDELIISDDGSTDNTIKIISSYHDSRIKLIKGPCKGYVQNFSNAISHSSGNYIFLSDQDDIWLPNKIKTIMPFFKKYYLIVHNAQLIDKDDVSMNELLHNSPRNFNIIHNLIKHQIYGCCLAFNSVLKEIIMPFPNIKSVHETWISLCAQIYDKHKIIYIEEPLIQYRRHGDNVSQFRKSNRSYFSRITERIVLLFFLIKRTIKYRLSNHQL